MNKSVVLLLIMLVALSLGSCGNGNKQETSGGSAPLFGKSDKEKADECVKTLGKNTEVLLVLPSSAPKCVFMRKKTLSSATMWKAIPQESSPMATSMRSMFQTFLQAKPTSWSPPTTMMR